MGLNLNLMAYPFNLYVYGVPEGRVRSMGGSHMGKVMSDYFKISGPDRGPDCGI